MGRTPKSNSRDHEDILGINHPSVSRKHLQISVDPVTEGSSVSRLSKRRHQLTDFGRLIWVRARPSGLRSPPRSAPASPRAKATSGETSRTESLKQGRKCW